MADATVSRKAATSGPQQLFPRGLGHRDARAEEVLRGSVQQGTPFGWSLHTLLQAAECDLPELHWRGKLESSVVRSIAQLPVREHDGLRKPEPDGEESGRSPRALQP